MILTFPLYALVSVWRAWRLRRWRRRVTRRLQVMVVAIDCATAEMQRSAAALRDLDTALREEQRRRAC